LNNGLVHDVPGTMPGKAMGWMVALEVAVAHPVGS